MSARSPVLLLVLASLLTARVAVADAERQFDTIASLGQRSVDIREGSHFSDSSDLARDNYRAFLDLASDDPIQRAQALRRLGDLALEVSEAEQLASNVDTVDAGSYGDAIELFRLLLDTYPDFERNDTVMYQLARAYEYTGAVQDALRVLDDLVTQYPDTPQMDEVQFRRGEMLFLNKDYSDAESAYSMVATIGESSRFYEQSLYKLGWSRFKLGWYEDCLAPFFTVLDRRLGDIGYSRIDDHLSTLNRADRELIEDTFRVLSISFSYMDGARSVASALDSRGQTGYGAIIYRNLGDLYLEKERFQDAARTYEAFIERNPTHPGSPEFQIEVIEAYKQGGFPTLVLDSKKRFVERYGNGSAFRQSNAPVDHETLDPYLRENLADLAQYYHAEGQAREEAAHFREAARWYRRHLAAFPADPGNSRVEFLLGEALFQSGDHAGAIEAYEHSAYGYPLDGREDEAAEAAYASVLAYRALQPALVGDEDASWHRRYIESGLRFGNSFPAHPESADVLTAIADELFRQDRFDEAIDVARVVTGRSPPAESDLLKTAWAITGHSLFDLGKFPEAEQAYYALRALAPAEGVDAHNEIDERIASSIYKQGEQARDAGDLETAVTHFRRLGGAVPGSGFRETADYDAAAALIAMGSWDRATSVLEDFRRTYPDSEYADDVTQKLAVTYLEAGHAAQAAAEFVRIANAEGSPDAMRREAFWRAAELYAESSEPLMEEKVLEEFLSLFPEPIEESVEIRYRLLELAERSGDDEGRTGILRDLVQVDANAGDQRSDRTRYLAAKASFELADPVRRSFMDMKLAQPLVESMARKRSLMEDVLKAYGDSAAYGVAEVTTAATFRLAEAYLQFSHDLLDSERPEGLDELALEQYDLLLEEQIFPFEEKAIELFEANTARAAEGIWDEWIEESYSVLAELMPARYAKIEKSEIVVTAIR